MKHTILLMLSGMAGVLCCVVVLVFSGSMYRSEEVTGSLSNVVEQETGQMAVQSEQDAWEIGAVCMEQIALAVTSDSDVTLEIMKADEGKGVLSMRLSEHFIHPNGAADTVASERTAIVSGEVSEEETQWKVKFYKNREDMENDAETYKTYQIGDGCRLQSPAQPKDGEMEFVVWKDVNDYIADFSVPVEQDQVYYAQWR